MQVPWNNINVVTRGTIYQIPCGENSNYNKKNQNIRHSGDSHNLCARKNITEAIRNKVTLYEQNKNEGTHTDTKDLMPYIQALNDFQLCYLRSYVMTDERFEMIADVYNQAARISTKNNREINLPSFFELAKIGSMYSKIKDEDTQKLLNLVKYNISLDRFNKISMALQAIYL